MREHEKLFGNYSENMDFFKHSILINFDVLKATHPHYKTIIETYPEISHQILVEYGTNMERRLVDYLIEHNYAAVYEGTLRAVKGYADMAEKFKRRGYSIELDVMAVPYLKSLSSTYTRYAMALQNNEKPRWVEKFAHDGSFDGVTNTTKLLLEQKLIDNVGVFVRTPEMPKQIYGVANESEFDTPIAAIEFGREVGRKEALNDFPTEHEMVISVLKYRQPELISALASWEDEYEKERQYFEGLGVSTPTTIQEERD